MYKLVIIGFLICGHVLSFYNARSQNINGEKIIVGRESITIINFPEKVLNINFSDDGAYDYYTPTRREEKSIAIQFNKEKKTGPNTNVLVNEGGRSHMFRLIYDSTYNINDDSRPPLWYDHSNLKELKAFVQRQKEKLEKPADEASQAMAKKEEEAQAKKEAEQRKAEAIAAKAKKDEEAAQKAKELEQQRKAEDQQLKQQAAELAKAKKEAEEKEKQAKIAAQKQAEAQKAADEKARKDAEQLARQKADEEKKLAALKAKQEAEEKAKADELAVLKQKQEAEKAAREQELKDLKAKKDAEALAKARADQERKEIAAAETMAKAVAEKEAREKASAEALAKAEREAEERRRLQEEKLAQQRAADEERKLKAEREAAKREEERQAAAAKMAQLEEVRKKQEEEKMYSEVGLWQRYGKKGIDVYNFPREQVATVISDFYIAKDTLRNFLIADSILKENIPEKLDIKAGQPVNKGVNITLENMVFKDVQTFYKLKVENTTGEDFLLGPVNMYWYDANDKVKQIIKSTYITYISFFPIIRPGTTQHLIFTTRSPNVIDNESLVLFINDRRKDKGGTSIVISGAQYNQELAKVQDKAKKGAKNSFEEKKPEPAPGKKSRGRKK